MRLSSPPEAPSSTSGTPMASSRQLTYEKKIKDSLLKITYTDNLRVYNYANSSGSAACQFHVYIDGEPCTEPAPLTGAVYTPHSAYTNPHHLRTLVGICTATASGPLMRLMHTPPGNGATPSIEKEKQKTAPSGISFGPLFTNLSCNVSLAVSAAQRKPMFWLRSTDRSASSPSAARAGPGSKAMSI